MHLCIGWESQKPAQHVAPEAAEQDQAESWLSAYNKQPSTDAPLTSTQSHTTQFQAEERALPFTPAGLPRSKDSKRLSLSVER